MHGIRSKIGGGSALALAICASVVPSGVASAQLSDTGGAGSFPDPPEVQNPLWEQYDACTGGGPASQQFPDFGDSVLQAADDFYISGVQTLVQVVALGSFSLAGPMGRVTVEIFDDDGPGGLPGTLLCSEVEPLNLENGAEINLVLDASCQLSSGVYWLSVYPVISFAESGQWFWSSNATGYGSEFSFQDPDGLVGNPCSSWGLGITDCGVGATFPDLCFGIGGLTIDDGTEPIPAVSPFGAIVLVLLLAAVSLLYLRRSQRT